MCKQMAAEMAAMEYGDLEGCLATNITSPFCESVVRQRAGRPRKYEGSCTLHVTGNMKVLEGYNKQQATSNS